MFNLNGFSQRIGPQDDTTVTPIPWYPSGLNNPRMSQASYEIPLQNIPQINASALNQGAPQPMAAPPPSPELQHISDVIGQYSQNKQTQQSGNNFLTQILANRMQPEAVDTSRSLLNSALTNNYSSPEQQMAGRYEAELAPYTSLIKGAGNMPSAVQEYQFFNRLSPTDQQRFLNVKRNTQYLNLGDRFVSPTDGTTLTKGVPPQDNPALKGAQRSAINASDLNFAAPIATAREVGKGQGEAASNLQADVASLPQLEDTVRQLNELGKTATYTTAGNLTDAFRRQSGMSMRQGAIDRAAYESMVSNQILPLLRRTFGAQFTEREGATLRATLGDVNKSPEEKEATLRSFIEQKKATIGSLQRQVDPSITSVGGQPVGNETPVKWGRDSNGNPVPIQ